MWVSRVYGMAVKASYAKQKMARREAAQHFQQDWIIRHGPIHGHLLKRRAKFLSATDDEQLRCIRIGKIRRVYSAWKSAYALAALKQMKFKKQDDKVVICF